MRKALAALTVLLSLAPAGYAADPADLSKKIDELSKQLALLKQQMADLQKQEASQTAKIEETAAQVINLIQERRSGKLGAPA